ncbi:cation transporter [archaeon]|nr:cation transporter [archaeon]
MEIANATENHCNEKIDEKINEEGIQEVSIQEESMQEKAITEEIIPIKGMHCNSCVESIESRLNALKGVESARVSLAEEKAFVKFDSAVIGLDRIKEEIREKGYLVDGKKSKKTEVGKRKGIIQGLLYGLVPHIGCIAFILAAVFGASAAVSFFKPLLLNPYFFYILIALSLVFATISAIIYLKKNKLLSFAGAGKKWKYLAVLYGTTLLVNLLLFMVIFPYATNIIPDSDGASNSITGAFAGAEPYNTQQDGYSRLTLKVSIPCPGHAPLITTELNRIDGVNDVNFNFPNQFEVSYDSGKTSKQEILNLAVFDKYKATVIGESIAQGADSINALQVDSALAKQASQTGSPATNSAGSSGSCGCGGCGGSGGSCGG